MNEIEQVWARLVSAARRAQIAAANEIPPGFAACVVAKCKTALNSPSIWEFLSIRALACAFLLMIVSMAVNYNIINDNWISNLAMNDSSSINDYWANSSAITDVIPELISAP